MGGLVSLVLVLLVWYSLRALGWRHVTQFHHYLDLPNTLAQPPNTPTRPRHPDNDYGGAVFAGTHTQNRQKMRESALRASSQIPTFTVVLWQKRQQQSKFGTK